MRRRASMSLRSAALLASVPAHGFVQKMATRYRLARSLAARTANSRPNSPTPGTRTTIRLLESTQVRIGPPLRTDRRRLLVPRKHASLVRERQQPCADRVEQRGVGRARKVGAADTSGEQAVAAERGILHDQRDVAGRVAGRVQDRDLRLAQHERAALLKPDGGVRRGGDRYAEHASL